ncbi:flagellar M-ring protein FliF [bacterium (Candidatus Blackallbacteria) CG17_big_fil_post_rev_8_21_14_2_50_48_46]|uniref:Flagellar M-ring protein n=1 Tax=bacterium (Candidatus Blackallbacteria) CG17_big_fil_post_rev_8_21_14_2_50_48_46 TaxID=2014261 RepID=A0A2M7G9B4_9BACT|nr:MAG: flagellar M-ring protein FliF [bacterium (Candidatus Blackallbacteria) CG18_big_fil_WC_8_21_14_2_50_49_26]PIW18698.1 MAG: flagellar M-ring protein FliF [bacterium (Candidatus Blackallbacteria) CG17_big_fil_post_rev_8_21_14_2_50_48_46]PIW46316.1 MAG: flagellar M-ring protein FliF [bacterium (Candidatus Blackallbacteria) CG13_big_fil_rev_8_21_14_2_50_49_14]
MAASYLQRLRDDTSKFLGNLSQTQKIGLGALSLVSIAALIALLIWAQQPQWATLYAELGSKDAALMVEYLKEKQILYQLRSQPQGTQILVPQQKVHDLRLEMAAQDLPKEGGVVGFELFDKDTMGITNNLFDLNYQRALAGELARTIMQMDAVERARVHLAIPKKQLFTQLEEPATASVTLRLKSGVTLSTEQVKGISKLVANSVPGLQQKHVSVTDTEGNLLYDSEMNEGENGQESTRVNGQRLEYQRTLEKRIRQDVEKILVQVVGQGNVTVQAKAELDFDKEETVSKEYTPTTGTKPNVVPAVRSEKESTENGQGSQTSPGGVPGVTSNIPTYQEVNGGSDNSFNRKEVVRNYEVPEVQTKRIKSPGQIRRLTLSVAINSLSPALNSGVSNLRPDDPILKNLRELAVGAAGLDSTRGDTIAIHALPFDDTSVRNEQEAMEQASNRDFWRNLLTTGAVSLGVLALLFVIYLAFGRRRVPTEGELVSEDSLLVQQNEGFALDDLPELPGLSEAAARRTRALRGLTQMAQEDPARMARLLRLWMTENN